jgi:ribosomal protein S4E
MIYRIINGKKQKIADVSKIDAYIVDRPISSGMTSLDIDCGNFFDITNKHLYEVKVISSSEEEIIPSLIRFEPGKVVLSFNGGWKGAGQEILTVRIFKSRIN